MMSDSKRFAKLSTTLLVVTATILGFLNLNSLPLLRWQEQSLHESEQALAESKKALDEIGEQREQINLMQKEVREMYRQISRFIQSYSRYDRSPSDGNFLEMSQYGYFCRFGHNPFEVHFWIPPGKKLGVTARLFQQYERNLTANSVPLKIKKTALDGSGWSCFSHEIDKTDGGRDLLKLLHNKELVFQIELDKEEFSTAVIHSNGMQSGPIWPESIWPKNLSRPVASDLDANVWTIGEKLDDGKTRYTMMQLQYAK